MKQPQLFRKRPVVIQATQWEKNGDHPEDDVMRPYEDTGESPQWPREGAVVRYFRHPSIPGTKLCEHCGHEMNIHGWIDTLEGGHKVCPKDWVITGVKGERYPCKPDIFEATYEAVDATILSPLPEGMESWDCVAEAMESDVNMEGGAEK